MADRRVAIRLGTEGRATVVRDLAEIGTTGDAAFNRVARAAARAGKDAADAIAYAERQAQKLQTIMPGVTPAKADAFAGARMDPGKSAQASASVFAAAYSQMEARAEALRMAIDPVYAAQKRFDVEIAEARGLVAAGALSLDDYSKRLVQLQGGLEATRRGHGAAGQSSDKMRQAMAGASYQIQDLTTQISMGANPINALVVQGGQLAGQFMHVEGAAGSFARFMMGGYGLAIQVALMALAPLVAKLWEESDATKKAAEAKEQHRQAVLALAEAQGKAIRTAERQQAIDTATIKLNLDAALAVRTRLAADLEAAKQAAQSSLDASRRGGERGDLAAMRLGSESARMAEIEKQQRENNELVEKLQRGFDLGYARMIGQRAEAASTPEGRIKRDYDRQIAEAMETLSGVGNGSRLRAKLDEIIAARDRELKAIEKSTVARDAETLTANQVAKMLRAELPGVHVTSTTGGKHVKNSYHYRNQAVDFVPSGGMSSMTKADVRALFESRGIQIVELLGPGDKGHSDHFHVAWTKGKLALDKFTDAAKRAKAAQKEFDDNQGDMQQTLDRLIGGFAKPDLGAGSIDDVIKDIDRRRDAKLAVGDYASGIINDQRERITMTERELQLAGANDNYREAELGKLRLILNLRRENVDTEAGLGAEILANAEKLDAMLAQLRRQEAAWNEIKSIGENAIDRIFDPGSAETWGERIKGVLNDLKNEFIKLALLNPLKNLLYGDDAPTITSVLGKLFGAAKALSPSTSTPTVPSHSKAFPFATGTEYAPGGTALVGEEGPEIVSLPRGSRVTTAAETRRLMASDNAGSLTVNVYANDSVLASTVRQWVAEGVEIASTRGAAGGAELAGTMQARRMRRRIGR